MPKKAKQAKPAGKTRKLSTPQKQRRTLQGTDSSDGRLGKRLIKTPRSSDKQLKGDLRVRKEQLR
jgi:hypothetical protein